MSFLASSYKNTSPERVFSFQAIVRNENTELGSPTLVDWIGSNEVVSLEKTNTDTYIQNNREVSFSLSEALAGYFPLLRGILASGQPQPFVLKADSKLKSFHLRYDADREAEAKDYLSRVLDIVKAEARFKQVLRKVIINQEKFYREERLLLTELAK